MIILGLGSNIGDRQASLQKAVSMLGRMIAGLTVSNVLESKAVIPKEAPESWNLPYLNMAVMGNTRIKPEVLLTQCKAMEVELGRTSRDYWAPREIDIDILATDDVIMTSGVLAIPHPQLLNRDFALVPLAQLAPNWKYPVAGQYFGKTAAEIVKARGYHFGPHLIDRGKLIHA